MSPSSEPSRYRAFRVAYDGRAYHGFQRQPDVPTVEGELLGAFDALGVAVLDVEGPRYAAAGRTDAGASALAQTIAAPCPEWLSPAALNSELPGDVRSWAAADVDPTFHPRHDPVEREYRYHLYAPDIDLELARQVGRRLEGTHDFTELTADAEQTERSVTAVDIGTAGDFITVTVRAPGFLRQQVRRMATLVRLVGRGERPPSFTERVLDGAPLPDHEAIPPAPAEPLVLVAVRYGDVDFTVDRDARRGARELFDGRSAAARGAGRALGAIATGLE